MFGAFFFGQPFYADFPKFAASGPSFATLLDIETEVEGVFYNYLLNALGLPAFESDTNAVLPTPRIEVTCQLREEHPNQQTISSGSHAGMNLYTPRRCLLIIDLTYSPARPQSPNVLRGTLRKCGANYPALKAAFAINSYYLLAPDTLR